MQPQTPAIPQAQTTGLKTLFVGNLSFQVERDHVYALCLLNLINLSKVISIWQLHFCREDFFKGVGEVIDIRFSSDAEGMFKGFGHVEFATAEEAQKVSFHLLVQFTASRDL